MIHTLIVFFVVGEDTHPGEKEVPNSVQVKIIPNVDAAQNDVLHLHKHGLFNLLVRIRRPSFRLVFEKSKETISALISLLISFAQVLELLFNLFIVFNCLIIIDNS